MDRQDDPLTPDNSERTSEEERCAPGTERAHRFLDPEFLSVEDVAVLLRCSEDTVLRIPRDQLPVYRVGKRNLYLRKEIRDFLRTCRVPHGTNRVETARELDRFVAEIQENRVQEKPDGVRERSPRRTR